MIAKRTKLLITSGIIMAMALLAGAAYAFELPPFRATGEIKEADLCSTLGDTSRVVTALKAVLPDRSSYSFHGSIPDPRRDKLDSSFRSDCFVDGDGKRLAWVGAQMLEYDDIDNWIKEEVAPGGSASSLTPFKAGVKAVASDKVAAIYLPCTAKAIGRHHLSVAVNLKEQGSASSSSLRKNLIDLVKNAAISAHKKARCELPSQVSI